MSQRRRTTAPAPRSTPSTAPRRSPSSTRSRKTVLSLVTPIILSIIYFFFHNCWFWSPLFHFLENLAQLTLSPLLSFPPFPSRRPILAIICPISIQICLIVILGLNTLQIVGIAIGSFVVLAAIVAAIVVLSVRRTREAVFPYRHRSSSVQPFDKK